MDRYVYRALAMGVPLFTLMMYVRICMCDVCAGCMCGMYVRCMCGDVCAGCMCRYRRSLIFNDIMIFRSVPPGALPRSHLRVKKQTSTHAHCCHPLKVPLSFSLSMYVRSLFGVCTPANYVCAVSVRCMCASKLCMCGLCSHVFVRLCMCGMYVRRAGTIIVNTIIVNTIIMSALYIIYIYIYMYVCMYIYIYI